MENHPSEGWSSDWARPQLLGEIQRGFGQKELARESFQNASALLTAAIAQDPENARTHAELGLAEAALGRPEEALREAQRAVDLQPVEKDLYCGPLWLMDQAVVNARLGRIDEAIKLIERLLAMPNTGLVISLWELKLHPHWDPLRGDPRFEKIIASLAPKETASK